MMQLRHVLPGRLAVILALSLGFGGLVLTAQAGGSRAAEVKFPPNQPAGPATTANTARARVLVTPPQCQSLAAHRPSPDVAYQPGVDSTGRPVVPADLQPQAAALSDGVVIDLILPFSTLVPAAPGLARSETGIGRIRIDPSDGKVWLDGQLLDDPAAHDLARACAQAYSAKP
jgi:hypothetical protein